MSSAGCVVLHVERCGHAVLISPFFVLPVCFSIKLVSDHSHAIVSFAYPLKSVGKVCNIFRRSPGAFEYVSRNRVIICAGP